MKLITYMRVSTAKQGHSGLGMEAQREAINRYVEQVRGKVVGQFVEVESGKNNSRPQLAKALHLAKVTGGTLVIAKLDRLSRNAAFLLTLRDAGVRFVAADMPEASHLTVGIMALMAEQERQAISQRTKEALAAAKRRGVKLGNPNGARALRRAKKGNAASLSAIKGRADRHAENLRPVIEAIKEDGVRTLAGIADELNERGMLTPRGRQWYGSTVRDLLNRLDGLSAV